MNVTDLRAEIEALHADPSGVRLAAGEAVDAVIDALDTGRLRVCEPTAEGWITHAWIKTAILLYFRRHDSVRIGAGGHPDQLDTPPSYFDKLPTKRNYAELGARCVPPGVARYGSYLGRGTILMPGYVNIGAYVDDGSMVDTWATVGSCAQIGKNVHLSGGVGVGGVLEPPQAQPVVIEDGAFVGSRSIVVEGVFVGREAVLGAGVVLTASTPIVDVRGAQPAISRGRIEPRSVVIPGTMPKSFPAGEFGVPCALVIGERSASTDRKTSLESAIRDYGVAV
jgi:2,3,4,5-tetrahydropyridine-2-carboxylate N-succinyltransferase